MRNVLRACALGLVFAVTGCSQASIEGSGKVITESRAVAGFSKVSLAGTGRIIIEQSGVESLTITADDNLLPHLTSNVEGGELKVRTKDGSLHPSQKIVYRLTVKSLDAIEVGGDFTVEATKLEADRLSVTLGGSGEITLAGKAHTLNMNLAGDGIYKGETFLTQKASITIAGSGRAVVAASETLDVNVMGDGSIEYIGNPTVTKQVLGSGSVRQR